VNLEPGQIETSGTRQTKMPGADDEIEWNLVGVIKKILRGRRVLLACSLSGLILGAVIAFVWPQWYAAEAVFLPPQVSEVSGAGSASSLLLQQDPSDRYIGMLGSRTVVDDVIDHVGLTAIYHAKTRSDARAKLIGHSKFTVSKNSLISVDITASEPKLAATIANAYLDALYRLNGSMVASASSYRRGFFEEQMASEKDALSDAEVALKQAEEKSGIVLPEGEAQAGLRATADLQAAIDRQEAALSAFLVGATEDNPRVIQARAELAALRSQLARQRSNSKGTNSNLGLVPANELPGLELEYMRKMREVKLNETLYDLLATQFEKARIASLDPGPQFQIVDRAVVPERKAGPPRKLIVVVSIAAGFIAGLLYVLLIDRLRSLIRACASDSILAPVR
jgi:tyrosine-protein kinase Etk/Wzc